MTAQLPSSKEQLLADIAHAEEKAATLCGPCADDHARLAGYLRTLLATHEQEPVATLDVQSGRTDGKKFALVYSLAAHQLPDDVYFLHIHPAPVPAVPDEIPAGLAGTIISLCAYNVRDKELAQKIYSAVRAAMLNGGNHDAR